MKASALRKTAGFFAFLVLVVMGFSAYVALVYHGDIDQGANWVVSTLSFENWIYLFAATLGVLFLILLVLFFVPSDKPVASDELFLACDNCGETYTIPDTGERPLYHTCLKCGASHVVEGEAAPVVVTPEEASVGEPTAVTVAPGSAPAGAEGGFQVVERDVQGVRQKFLVLHCTNCETNFETPYTRERPLVTTCTNCGRRGILKAPIIEAKATGRPIIDIEGIGPVLSQRLIDAGVTTTHQLRASDPALLAGQVDVPETTVRQWQAMAELMDVKGIGPQYSELLVRSGVSGVEELGGADPKELLLRIEQTNEGREVRITGGRVGLKTVQNWVKAAKRAARGQARRAAA